MPWSEPGSGFTLWFEALVVALAREMPVRAVAVDETACRRGHDYMTLFADLDRSRLLYATPGRSGTSAWTCPRPT